MEEGNLCERCGRATAVLFFASLDNKLVCAECRDTRPCSPDAVDHAEVRVTEPAENAPAHR